MNDKNAVLLINKSSGVTSFECLKYIKRFVNRKTGHCGTLDKFASGLIIALSGKYTKLTEKFMGMDKEYIATIVFGKQTDTLDPEGEIIKTSDIPLFTDVVNNVKKLTGNIMQVPPVYSAIHVNGKRSYQLARNGNTVELKERPITIYSSEIIEYKDGILKIKLNVSKGTYIRSYARDLGALCNSCAYVSELKRTKIGPFSVEDAIDYNDEQKLLSVDEISSIEIIGKLGD